MQELFNLLVRHAERKSVVPTVFSYWNAECDGQQLYAMLYWESFMVCMMFWEPQHK
jgi:hypothetical protein